ncbi:hypothetical protein [Paludibacterium denitrificans]|uniref:hypothetical protein n=1 Tax=Paludibacterium denitrificans TaxID=2675226 RepID=UPI001E48AD7E|nr:hypothetical protein [Paludibacterium denitrificans]
MTVDCMRSGLSPSVKAMVKQGGVQDGAVQRLHEKRNGDDPGQESGRTGIEQGGSVHEPLRGVVGSGEPSGLSCRKTWRRAK